MGGSGDQCICIEIEDDSSSLTVIRVAMPLADFAECLTGHGHMKAIVERWVGDRANLIGKKLEVRDLYLHGHAPYGKFTAAQWVREHPELVLDGWHIHDDGTRSQQNTPNKHRVSLARYVDAE